MHSSAAMFIHLMDVLQTVAPASDFDAAKGKFHDQWLLGVLDGELTSMACNAVPPGDPKAIGAFRPAGANFILFDIVIV